MYSIEKKYTQCTLQFELFGEWLLVRRCYSSHGIRASSIALVGGKERKKKKKKKEKKRKEEKEGNINARCKPTLERAIEVS